MTSKIASVLLVAVATFLMFSGEIGADKAGDAIKAKINDAKDALLYIGIGGKYGKLRDSISKKNLIESDHFPPKSVYAYARDQNIRQIDETNMAAVSISYTEHRKFLTTGIANEAAGYFNNWLKTDFQLADYGGAINKNIQAYKEAGFLGQIKKGVMDGLSVHVTNGLITAAERAAIIKEFALDHYDKSLDSNKDRKAAEKYVHG